MKNIHPLIFIQSFFCFIYLINSRYASIKNLEGFVKRNRKEFNILILISETFKVWVICMRKVTS